MNKVEKQEAVKQLHGCFEKAMAVVVADFQGMDVESLTAFRNRFRKVGGEYFVAKNTLARIAVQDTVFEPLKEHFKGVNSVGVTYDDPVALAKVLHDTSKDFDNFNVKFGFLARGEKFLSEGDVAVLASLPSREELLCKLAFLLKSQHSKFVMVLNEVIAKFVRTVDAVRAKKSKEQ